MEEQRDIRTLRDRVSSRSIPVVGERRSSDRYRPQRLEDSRRQAGLFSAAGHDHWVTAPFAGGSFNDGDLPQVTFTVDGRKLTLVEDSKLSTEQQAQVPHTMQAKVLQSESYPLISFHSTKIEKTAVNDWLV